MISATRNQLAGQSGNLHALPAFELGGGAVSCAGRLAVHLEDLISKID